MPPPAFEFTSRAIPLVQMGRSERRDSGNRWQDGRWSEGRWGVRDWEVIWSDLTCEIHEVTVDTGRGGASDRFVPGTADIVASNVNQVSEMIFPRVPEPDQFFEYVEQPPIDHEEELQAPEATTVISDGWKFSDDFETRPPHWKFPPAHATTGTYPTVPFLWGDGYVTPETYGDTAGTTHEAHGAMQWTGLYPDLTTVECHLGVDQLRWLAAPSAGTAQCVIDVYAYANTVNRAGNCCRFTMTPVFGGANTMTVQFLRLAADGSTVTSLAAHTVTETAVRGSDGVFPALDLRILFDPDTDSVTADVNGGATPVLTWTDWADGGRIGFAVHYLKGTVSGAAQAPPPQVTSFEGPDFDDDFARAPGSGWKVNRKYTGVGPMIVEGGVMRAPVDPVLGTWFNGRYSAQGSAQWVSDFVGDQFIEIQAVDLSQPSQVSNAGTTLELYLKGNPRDLRSIVARISYEPHWGGDDNTFFWILVQMGPNGEWVYDPDVEGESFGTFNLGPVDGIIPDATWRLEADTAGEVRLYYQHHLFGHALFPNIPDGGRIGIRQDWGSGGNLTSGARRGRVPGIERAAAGLQAPLGTEELGLWVRIGVDHVTLGNQWFFRGFVDGMTPTYVPDRDDAVRIECIDALGEAGRVFVDGDQLPNQFVPAPGRIRQILNAAQWPPHFRTVGDDSTIMSRPSAGKAVDLLTHVAESCGGAVYGDPTTGDVVFKGMDWQGVEASAPPDAFITNFRPDFDDGFMRVCPAGWERSSRRSDMTTRVRFSTVETSVQTFDSREGEPITREWRTPDAERYYGVELYERTLLATVPEKLNELAIRQLRLRHPNRFPRVEAVLLDAATAPEALDLMATATFTLPSVYHCQLHRGDGFVFNRKMLVTGVRHRMTPHQWTCRLALDPSSMFAEFGGRWDQARWGFGEWGVSR